MTDDRQGDGADGVRAAVPVRLDSFRADMTVLVVGASGGIGGALTSALAAHPQVGRVFAFARDASAVPGGDKTVPGPIDVEDEATIAEAAASIAERAEALDLVLVASGLLHGPDLKPERAYKHMTPNAFERLFAVNATGPALIAKHTLDLLPRDRKVVFAAISARIGSIEDNRIGGWHAYRASKAALNMVLRCLAIEVGRKRPEAVVAGLHPGTTDTGLSDPFQANVPEAKLFAPAYTASKLLNVLDGLTPADSGRTFAYDGKIVPF